jgi:hypothetical protein
MISRRLPFHHGVSGTIPFPSPVKSNRDSIYREKFGYALPVPRPPKPPGFDWAAPARPRVGLVRAGIARVRVRGSGYLREGLKD